MEREEEMSDDNEELPPSLLSKPHGGVRGGAHTHTHTHKHKHSHIHLKSTIQKLFNIKKKN